MALPVQHNMGEYEKKLGLQGDFQQYLEHLQKMVGKKGFQAPKDRKQIEGKRAYEGMPTPDEFYNIPEERNPQTGNRGGWSDEQIEQMYEIMHLYALSAKGGVPGQNDNVDPLTGISY